MIVSECPQCGASASPSDKRCSYCKAEFFITSIAYLGSFDPTGIGKYLKHYKELARQDDHEAEGTLGLGLCYLQMGTYPLAQKCFERLIDKFSDMAEPYYYYTLSRIAGRRLLTLTLNEVRTFEMYLNTAIQIGNDEPHFKLLLAMLKRDYYEMSGMTVSGADSKSLLIEIARIPINQIEIAKIRECTRVENAEQYYGIVTVI